MVDLGVMVPADKILDAAVEHGVDIVGLSGLITPSLDEMVHVAKEMKRRDFTVPLLIGGATTSAKHTAVKIAPAYDHPVIHVLDASKSVDVVEKLLSVTERDAFLDRERTKQRQLAESYARQQKSLVPLAEARRRRFVPDWESTPVRRPEFLGRRVVESIDIGTLIPFIDWSPFFLAWELKGKFPAILDHPKLGEAARDLYENAQAMLERIVEEGRLQARAVYGFWPAAAEGDDIVLFCDESRREVAARFHTLRQQWERRGQSEFRALSDYVAPIELDRPDYLGAFCVTSGVGAREWAAEFAANLDDYSEILVKALADRLAEALAEYLHARVRREWGYGRDEQLSAEELVSEKYEGIRPAPGYPAQPDHTEKRTLFELLDVSESIGVTLTDSLAMAPAASVCGLYFSHPQARYFSIAPIGRDQIEDYARRKDMAVGEVERWLRPYLGYE